MQAANDAHLHRQMIGSWWSDDRWILQPFSRVTFYEDGRFTRTNANIQIGAMHEGYWRVTNKWVFLTVNRNGLLTDSLMTFKVDSVTDHEMVLTNSIERLRIRLTKVLPRIE